MKRQAELLDGIQALIDEAKDSENYFLATALAGVGACFAVDMEFEAAVALGSLVEAVCDRAKNSRRVQEREDEIAQPN